MTSDLTQEFVSDRLLYNPETGSFTWKQDTGRAKAGEEAGCIDGRGFRLIRLNNRLYQASYLAWLIITGEWPSSRMARINRDPGDNRWSNLALQKDLRQPLTAARLREVVAYDPETGQFTWKLRVGVKAKIGAEAGWRHSAGYVGLNVAGHKMFAHQAAWLYMTGKWPSQSIDHRNGNPSDNRWSNLRLATGTQNSANMRRKKTNKSGFKGVSRSNNGKAWVALIHDGKTKYLGTFPTPEEAHKAYMAAAIKRWGEYARAS